MSSAKGPPRLASGFKNRQALPPRTRRKRRVDSRAAPLAACAPRQAAALREPRGKVKNFMPHKSPFRQLYDSAVEEIKYPHEEPALYRFDLILSNLIPSEYPTHPSIG